MAAQQEVPILEGNDLVHFVYRGDVPDIALNDSMLPFDEQLIMHPLDGTGFYFRSLRLKPVHTALKHPGLFGKVATQSLLFAELEDELVALIGKGAEPDLCVHVAWSAYDLRMQDRDAIEDHRRLLELLQGHGFEPTTSEVAHGVGGWGESGG